MNLRHPAPIFKFLSQPQSEQPVDAGYFIHEEILNQLSCFNVGSIAGCSFVLQGRFKEQNVFKRNKLASLTSLQGRHVKVVQDRGGKREMVTCPHDHSLAVVGSWALALLSADMSCQRWTRF